jgi:hypothetical protein
MGVSINDRKVRHTDGTLYGRTLWRALSCSVCSRGAIAKIYDNGSDQTALLVDFILAAVEQLPIPAAVPNDILKEFREAELVASYSAYRSGSAMLRSVLEKTLKKNGYDVVEVRDSDGKLVSDKQGLPKKSSSLLHRIDAAAADKVITETRQKKAHENIRVLGNDILHDEWRAVVSDEFHEAHKYAQRILEDFYDDRPTVEKTLTSQNRPFIKTDASS